LSDQQQAYELWLIEQRRQDQRIKESTSEAFFGLTSEEQGALEAALESYGNVSTVAEIEQWKQTLPSDQRAAVKKFQACLEK
jgi:hypothetical protein